MVWIIWKERNFCIFDFVIIGIILWIKIWEEDFLYILSEVICNFDSIVKFFFMVRCIYRRIDFCWEGLFIGLLKWNVRLG